MSVVPEWSTNANENNSPAPDGAPEGMPAEANNDVLREMMASLARWYQDSNGSLVSTDLNIGINDGYAITSNESYDKIASSAPFAFRPHDTNTQGAGVEIDGELKGVFSSTGASSGGELIADVITLFVYNSNLNGLQLVSDGHYPAPSTFAPSITADTDGDLEVSYSTRAAQYWTVGDVRFVQMSLEFTPTFTTASGKLRVRLGNSGIRPDDDNYILEVVSGNVPFSGSQIIGLTDSEDITLWGHGSGIDADSVAITDLTSGSSYSLYLQGFYPA